ncbi:AraC family transcriptional regulator [Paenibacillus selenitireducens]|uniref:AraC family transcriptional regulator n=1 Tax=Paenibacillus selenitireducens TaxID=1324314 RepID=A0A1T2X2D8_9BACL|nr:AraC family transcriptional regulator [Paenibacillus selenitireducens]OPA73886.1 AraC family transcriptional regulator [Paenibacillus selenitireducens]
MMNGFPYEVMLDKQDALERLDLRVYWGNYEIRVLRCHLTSFPPGKVVSFHKHAEFEFHFIPRGKGMVILIDEPYHLREGMFYLTGPNVVHYQEADPVESMEELCLHIDIIDLGATEEEQEGHRPYADPWEIAEAQDCIEKLKSLPLKPTMDVHRAMPCFLEAYQASQQKYIGLYTTIKQTIVQILLRAVRSYESNPMETDLPSRDMKAYRYQLALEYIHANSSSEVVLDDVADKLRISSRQLQRILKEQGEGRSFSEILEDVRLEAVCRRLVETKWPIDKIAIQEGFSNGSYLHTVFRKRYGFTPSEYRRTNVKS